VNAGRRDFPLAAVFGMTLVLAPISPVRPQTISGTTATGIHYEVGGTGDPVVLIHGFSMDLRAWAAQAAVLESSFRVIRYDLRGHGGSPLPEAPYSAIDDLASVLDAAGVARASLVGLSAGAEVSIDFALEHPDRVERLVLASPGLGGYVTDEPMTWMQPVFEAAGAGDAPRAARLWSRTPIMTLESDTSGAAMLREIVMSNQALWTLRTNPARPLQTPAVQRLEAIRAPTLVLVGEKDLSHILAIGRLLAERIPGARAVTIEGAGHILNLDAPDRFTRLVIRFLSEPR